MVRRRLLLGQSADVHVGPRTCRFVGGIPARDLIQDPLVRALAARSRKIHHDAARRFSAAGAYAGSPPPGIRFGRRAGRHCPLPNCRLTSRQLWQEPNFLRTSWRLAPVRRKPRSRGTRENHGSLRDGRKLRATADVREIKAIRRQTATYWQRAPGGAKKGRLRTPLFFKFVVFRPEKALRANARRYRKNHTPAPTRPPATTGPTCSSPRDQPPMRLPRAPRTRRTRRAP